MFTWRHTGMHGQGQSDIAIQMTDRPSRWCGLGTSRANAEDDLFELDKIRTSMKIQTMDVALCNVELVRESVTFIYSIVSHTCKNKKQRIWQGIGRQCFRKWGAQDNHHLRSRSWKNSVMLHLHSLRDNLRFCETVRTEVGILDVEVQGNNVTRDNTNGPESSQEEQLQSVNVAHFVALEISCLAVSQT